MGQDTRSTLVYRHGNLNVWTNFSGTNAFWATQPNFGGYYPDPPLFPVLECTKHRRFFWQSLALSTW